MEIEDNDLYLEDFQNTACKSVDFYHLRYSSLHSQRTRNHFLLDFLIGGLCSFLLFHVGSQQLRFEMPTLIYFCFDDPCFFRTLTRSICFGFFPFVLALLNFGEDSHFVFGINLINFPCSIISREEGIELFDNTCELGQSHSII